MFRCHGTFGISLNRNVFIRGPKVAVGNAQLVNLSLGAFKKGFDKGSSLPHHCQLSTDDLSEYFEFHGYWRIGIWAYFLCVYLLCTRKLKDLGKKLEIANYFICACCLPLQAQKLGFMENIPSFLKKCFKPHPWPPVLEQYLGYVKSLEFDTDPDYSLLRYRYLC